MVTIDGTEIAGATIDGEAVVEITVDGDVVWVAISTLMEIFSGTAYNGQKVEFSLSGNSGASSLTFTGVETTASGSASDYNSGGSFTANVGGNQSPTNESITIEGNGSTSNQSQSYSNTTYENDFIYVDGVVSPSSESVTIEPKSTAGSVEWTTDTDNRMEASAIGGGKVYAGGEHSYLNAFDIYGNSDWSKQVNFYEYDIYDLAATTSAVYIIVYDDGKVYKYDQDGNEKWKNNDVSGIGTCIDTDGSYIYAGGESDIQIIDTSGNTQYSYYIGESIENIAEGASQIYGVTFDGKIYATDQTGTEQWTTTLNTDSVVSLDADGSQVYVLSEGDASVYAYDTSGNKQWETALDPDPIYLETIITDGSSVYVSDGDAVYSYDTSGNKQWYSNTTGGEGISTDGSYIYGSRYSDSSAFKMSIGVSDPSVSVESETVSVNGLLSSTYSESISLSTGTKSVDISSLGDIDVDIEWTEDHRTRDPSASIDGSTVSHSGILSNGQTETGNVSISSDGDYSVSTSTNGGSATFNVDWTEVTASEDPSLTINGTTFSHTGILSAGSTKSFTPSEGLFGTTTDTLDLAMTDGKVDVNFDLEIQDHSSVTINTLPANWSTNYKNI